MANFPTSLDSLTNPTSSDKLNNPSHSQQHQNVNDIVEALEAKLGIGASTPTAGKVLRATGVGTTAYGQVDISTDVASFTSAALRAALSDETGTGAAVFATSPTIVTPTIASFANANHDHTNSAGGGALGTDAISSASMLATGVVTSPKQSTELQQGWQSSYGDTAVPAPSTVTYIRNRSYELVFNSVDLTGFLSNGMKLKLPRAVTPPTQCTDLESGSLQYWSKTSPTGISFTDDWSWMAWVKLESYGATKFIVARRNANTEGFSVIINASGQIDVWNGRIAGNNSQTTTYSAIPLGEWVHLAGTVNLSGTSTLVYIDGVSVQTSTTVTGTITALVQGTTALTVGAQNTPGNYFDGKIAQVGVFNAVLSAATIRSYASQTLSGSETNCIGCWTFNGNGNDSNANANNLTAQGSATATTTDSPFNATEFGIITANSFSTNTTLTVQVPLGYALPTSGGINSMSYSTGQPYGFPMDARRWQVMSLSATVTTVSPANKVLGLDLDLPVGKWVSEANVIAQVVRTTGTGVSAGLGISSSSTTFSNAEGVSFGYGTASTQPFGTSPPPVNNVCETVIAPTVFYVVAGGIWTTFTPLIAHGSPTELILHKHIAQLAYI